MHPFIVLVYRDMRKDYEKLFTNLDPKKPPRGLFDRIILAIKQEQELRHTKKIAVWIFIPFVNFFSCHTYFWSDACKSDREFGDFLFHLYRNQ